jgi:hypothetical protein
VQDRQDVVKLFALKEVETLRLIVAKTLMVMRRITRTTEGFDHSLMPGLEVLVLLSWRTFVDVSLACLWFKLFSLLSPLPSNASYRRRPSPFIFLLLNLELCMKPGLVVVSV